MLYPLRPFLSSKRGNARTGSRIACERFWCFTIPIIIQHIRTVHFPVSCGVRTVLIVRSALCAIQRAVSPLSFAVIIPYPVMEGVGLSLPGVARVRKNQTSVKMVLCHHAVSGRIVRKYIRIPEVSGCE